MVLAQCVLSSMIAVYYRDSFCLGTGLSAQAEKRPNLLASPRYVDTPENPALVNWTARDVSDEKHPERG
jgi:hypothetical protein